MRFTMMLNGKPAVIPDQLIDAIKNLAKAHGFEVTSVIPESMIGNRLLALADLVTTVKDNKRLLMEKHDGKDATDGSENVGEDRSGDRRSDDD